MASENRVAILVWMYYIILLTKGLSLEIILFNLIGFTQCIFSVVIDFLELFIFSVSYINDIASCH